VSALPSSNAKIFRSIRAGLIYNKREFDDHSLSLVKKQFESINVEFIQSDRIFAIERSQEFGILGVLGLVALDECKGHLDKFPCLKFGFYDNGSELDSIRKSLKLLSACVICLGSGNTTTRALTEAAFHFYESLTMPSLLNIDLADVEAIAEGIGISFNQTGNESDEIIDKLPKQSYVAKSALLHFSCKKDVTLEEVYDISRAISIRREFSLSQVPTLPNEKAVYKRINIKMGLRISTEDEDEERSELKKFPNNNKQIGLGKPINTIEKKPRISLTAILFGI